MNKEPPITARSSTTSFPALVIAVLGDEWLTADEVLQRARAQADPASATLWAALRRKRIDSAHALTRRLKRYEGEGLERGGELRGCDLWGVSRLRKGETREIDEIKEIDEIDDPSRGLYALRRKGQV